MMIDVDSINSLIGLKILYLMNVFFFLFFLFLASSSHHIILDCNLRKYCRDRESV
jgi:hypothetical protein